MIIEEKLRKLMIEVTSWCNYKCDGCPTLNLPRGNRNMDPALFKRIFDEVGNTVEKVMLWNYGESLSHPKIPELLDYAGGFSCTKVLSTNGSYFNKFKDLSFLKSLDVLVVSINGLDQETYSMHQRGGNLNNVLSGTRRVCEYLKDSKTVTVFQTVLNKYNIGRVDDINDFAKELGFKEVTLKSFNVMDGKADTFEKFVPSGSEFSRYAAGFAKEKPGSKSDYCQYGMVINWNGEVNPCCWDYKGSQVLGNVGETGVLGVWSGEKAKLLRDSVSSGEFMKICDNCEANRNVKKWQIR